ncbi:MAG: ATP-binding cassette domain-containing protein [Saprospiraceae bacterium]
MSILKVTDLVKQYGTQTAVDHISFEINKGEIVGFLGPNGAGKSTTMKMIAGILQPDSGEVQINDIILKQDDNTLKKSIAYLPEQNPLYPDLYVREALEFMSHLHQLKNVKQIINDAIKVTGLEKEQFKQIGALSKGYKQRVGLAQSILHQPDLYILDEATTGLDPNQILDIRDLIRSLGKDHAILISTHILQEVESICQRCLVIHQGRIIADEPMNSFKNKLVRKPEASVSFAVKVPVDLIKRKWSSVIPGTDGKSFIIADDDPLLTQHLFQWAVDQHLVIDELKRVEHKMEDVFHSLTQTE